MSFEDMIVASELCWRKLIKEEEKLRIKRIEILGEIAQLKDIPLTKLNKELGIKIAKRA